MECPFWGRPFKSVRRQNGKNPGETDFKSDQGGPARGGRDRCDPVVIGDNGDGCRICKLWYYETLTGSGNYHGSEYWYDGYVMDLKPDRN